MGRLAPVERAKGRRLEEIYGMTKTKKTELREDRMKEGEKLPSTFPAHEPAARITAKEVDGEIRHEIEILKAERFQATNLPIDVYCEPAGHVVITRDPVTKHILAVTRQDDDGRIISIIAEGPNCNAAS